MTDDIRERDDRPRRRRRKRRRRHPFRRLLFAVCAVAVIGGVFAWGTSSHIGQHHEIKKFAREHGLSLSDYPESIISLYERNPETKEFVLHYPLEHGQEHEVDLSDYRDTEGVPLFMQWDSRWGYLDYGNDVVGLTGCGPVSLAMAGYAVTKDDVTFRPDNVIKFAIESGYCVPGNGSSWTLISEGGERLGLDVVQIPLDKNRIIKNLEVGNPIICIMGPGVFTSSGHFIVLTAVEDGKFRINDPNSYKNSQRLWDYEEFQDQIRNLWVVRD